MHYQAAVRYLYSLGRELAAPTQAAIAKFDLENIRLLAEHLGHPERSFEMYSASAKSILKRNRDRAPNGSKYCAPGTGSACIASNAWRMADSYTPDAPESAMSCGVS